MILWFLVFTFLFCSILLLLVYGGYSVFIFRDWNKDYNITKRYDFFPTVSIVVPVYNEEKTIAGKLRNLLEIDYPVDKMEIIVVDDGSTDKTADVTQLFMKNGVKMLRQRDRKGKIFALNLAFPRSHGDVLITTDADVRTPKSILKEVMPYFADRKVGAVCASQVLVNVDESRSTLTESRFQRFYTLLRQRESAVDSTIVFNGEFTAIRKELLDQIPAEAGVDDVEIPIMVRKKGYRCVLIHEAVFYDFAPSKFKIRWKQKITRSQGIIKALWRHKEILFNTKYGIYGKIIYPVEFFMNILCPYLLFSTILFGLLLLITNLQIGLITFMTMFFVVCVALLTIYFKLKSHLSNNRGGLSLISAAWNLFLAQILLFLGSLRCLLGSSFHKWEKIEDTRRFS